MLVIGDQRMCYNRSEGVAVKMIDERVCYY